VPNRPADNDSDVIRATRVERVLHEIIADLLGGGHGQEPVTNPFVRYVLRQTVAAQ
jgi:hypothetical protein